MPAEIILAQVRAVAADIGVDAVKVGMLATAPVVLAVARALDELPAGTPVVVDPVMVAESGARLLDPDAHRALLQEIVPRATVLTPNLPEARVLAGVQEGGAATPPEAAVTGAAGAAADTDDDEAESLLRAVLALGPRCVVLTGGHRSAAVDLLLDADGEEGVVRLEGERHPAGAAHGSGCTHSAVLAAQLALGRSRAEAARIARQLAGEAVANGLRDVGAGAGPVDVLEIARFRSR
jgi:hydroxymethylpyrimidine/phosphomethylpyrimidine kinase